MYSLKQQFNKTKSFFKLSKKNNIIENHDSKHQIDLDKKLVLSLAKSRIPTLRQLKHIGKYLNKREKRALIVCFFVILASTAYLTFSFLRTHLHEVPKAGGEYREGLVGAPQYINPLYSSVNDVDNDLASLIYSSLFKRGKNGELINDLTQSYEISPDSKTYTIKLIDNAKWQTTGEPVTADDVVYTFNAIKDNQYKSPLRISYTGVEIEKIDDKTVRFTLTEPYAPFLDLLTFGILPANIWSQIPADSTHLAELNIKPIGSGPFLFKNLKKDKSGNIKEYTLEVNKDYYGQKPYVNLIFKCYPNFEEAIGALNSNQIDGLSYLPTQLKGSINSLSTFNLHKLYLPQLTALFINQKENPALGAKEVRQALAYALDKDTIINEVLGDDAYNVDGPILNSSFAYFPDIKKYEYNPEKAAKMLDDLGWKIQEIKKEDVQSAQKVIEDKNTSDEEKAKAQKTIDLGQGNWRKKGEDFLIIRLVTIDRDENNSVLDRIKSEWEKIGIKSEISTYPNSEIQNSVLKPRNFDILFYALVMGTDPDPYPFWHSSQTGGKGFNIIDFTNKEVDQILEDARIATDQKVRQDKYKRFQEIIAEEEPVIFMYSTTYTYIQSKNIKGFDVKNLYLPKDRFANINEWYLKTSRSIDW